MCVCVCVVKIQFDSACGCLIWGCDFKWVVVTGVVGEKMVKVGQRVKGGIKVRRRDPKLKEQLSGHWGQASVP